MAVNLTVFWIFVFLAAVKLDQKFVLSALPPDIYNQIEASRADVNRIKASIIGGDRKGKTFEKLALLSDDFPNRISGSETLEDSIKYVMAEMVKEGLENVHGENVTVPKWTRGNEFAEIVSPMRWPMFILGLGTSIGTNGTNLTAQAIVVTSFDDLEEKSAQVHGKIVVYNQNWVDYGTSVAYRSTGATRAAQHGAVAALIRSVTDLSLYSPHTGVQNYNVTKIPVACITVEDAEMLHRLYMRNETNIQITINMEAENYEDVISQNVVAEITGSVKPDEVVIFGGHIDTWDVGTGAMDDGGGLMISWEALTVIRKLELRPKRTLRVVLWTSEEFGLYGGEEYYEHHKNDSEKVSLIMESDAGVFNPRGLRFTGSESALEVMQQILLMVADLNASTVMNGGGASSDTGWWVNEKGVPGAELYSYNENYFYYHHTHGDTMTVLDTNELDRATALWATAVYAVANLDDRLTRTNYDVTLGSDKISYASLTFILTALNVILLSIQSI